MFRTAANALGRFLIAFGQPAAPRHRPPKRHASTAAFNRHATKALENHQGDTVAAGVVQILGIEQIKAELGARWPKVKDRASRVIEETIRAHLCEEDLFYRQDSENYVLCFRRFDRATAEAETKRIVAEVQAHLSASVPEYASASLRHTVSEVDVDLVLSDDNGPLATISRQLNTIRNEVDRAVERARTYLTNQAEVRYLPVWTCASGMVQDYVARLDERCGNELLTQLRLISDADTLAELTAEIDGVVLGRAVAALHDALQAGNSPTLVLPVNYHTLNAGPARHAYLPLCRGIPEGYKKHLLFEVYAVPENVPETRLIEVLQSIRACGRGVSIEVDPGSRTGARLLDKGLAGITINLRHLRPNDKERLVELVRMAKLAGLKIRGHGAKTRGAGQMAMKLGIHALDGDAVAPMVDAPNRRYRLPAPFGGSDTDQHATISSKWPSASAATGRIH
jgi:GGDEF domain-containing protein